MVHNFVLRILPEYQDGDNVNPVGYRFEILYISNLLITDGVVYDSFEKCVESVSAYLLRLHSRKGLEPIVVDIRDL